MHRAIASATLAATFALAALAFLLWLALQYIPYQSSLMIILDAQVVTPQARWVMATFSWVFRMQPIAALLSLPLGGVAIVGLLVGASRWGAGAMARAVFYVSLGTGIGASAVSAGAVIATHQAMAASVPKDELSDRAWEVMWPQRQRGCADEVR